MKNDICENKHGGIWTSQKAFERAKPNMAKERLQVLMAVEKSLNEGITSKEYAEQAGKPLNAVSGRFTELARDGWIVRNNETRGGAAVWQSV